MTILAPMDLGHGQGFSLINGGKNATRLYCSMILYRPLPITPDCMIVGFILFDTVPEPDRRCTVRFIPHFDLIDSIRAKLKKDPLEGTLRLTQPKIRSMIAMTSGHNPCLTPNSFTFPEGIEFSTPWEEREFDFDVASKQLETDLFRLSQVCAPKLRSQRSSTHGQAYLQQAIKSSHTAVWHLLEKDIKVSDFTMKGDPYTIFAAYTDAGQKVYRMIEPVSLFAGTERAKVLCLSWEKVRKGFEEKLGMKCQMSAIVEDHATIVNAPGNIARSWMQDTGIVVESVSALPRLAADARVALACNRL